jgi:hypothetical protein
MMIGTSALAQSAAPSELGMEAMQTVRRGKYELMGCFDKPCAVEPSGSTIFGFRHDVGPSEFFSFLGRTGEKTFDLRVASNSSVGREAETFHYYFNANDSIYLWHAGMFKDLGCKDGDTITLKTLSLTGNRLRFQIILPKCLRPNTP